jgi:glucose/arabinose dehydrogenase
MTPARTGLRLTSLVSLLAAVAGAGAADLAPGLVGEYFAMDAGLADFPALAADRKPTLVRVDKEVNFAGTDGEFHKTRLTTDFYARWSGVLHVEKAGAYTLATESDDGSRVSVDGKQVVDNGGPHGMIRKEGQVELGAGDHPILVEYYQGTGGSGCRLLWKAPGGADDTPVPGSALKHAKGAEAQIAWDQAAWKKRKGSGAVGSGWFYETKYGPFIADTIEAPGKNIAIKGTAVKLTAGAGEEAVVGAVAFDSDLLRVSAGWTGGYLELKGVAYDGAHGVPGPLVNGTEMFGTPVGPGWAKGDSFADPRSEPYGPLPADWAHFKGLYQYGDQVVFSYSVGGGAVLELPAFEGGGKAISRTFNLSGFAAASMIVAELPEGKGALDGALVELTAGEHVVSAGLVGAPAGVTLAVVDNRIVMKVPALKAGVFKLVISSEKAADLATLLKGATTITDPATLTKGGPPHWAQAIETKGAKGEGEAAYVVDTITVPEDNPFKSKMRLTGFDFFSDGRAAVCTWNGDVWVVSGIDAGLEKVSWRRFAAGLHQPLGLKIVDDQVYTTCRDGIVRLKDLNNDGEADFYENFNGDVHTTPAFHEFAFDLQTDPQGNFYFAKAGPVRAGGRGWETIGEHNGVMLKVSKDGSTSEVYATGFRAPNGMSISPDGQITTGDNEGTWTPTSRINLIEKGGFYGVPDLAHRKVVPTDYDKPIFWLPHGGIDNSCGGQAWVIGDKWGAPKGSLVHLSYGTSSLFLVAWSKEGSMPQGGATKVPVSFNTGMMRARFNSLDGQLYLAGMKGWQTNGTRDGGFQRVRYTGKPVTLPIGYVVKKNGISLTFQVPLDRALAADKANWSATQWNYLWTGNYGSPEMKPSTQDKQAGHDPVDITAITLSADGKTVFLEIPAIKPVMQMKLSAHMAAADGTEISQDFYNTVNVVGEKSGP